MLINKEKRARRAGFSRRFQTRMWNGASVALLCSALLCWWFSYVDAAFVVATLGIVAWFLSLRNRLHIGDIEDQNAHNQEGSSALGND